MLYRLLSKIHDNYIAPIVVQITAVYLLVSNNFEINLPTIDIPNWLLLSIGAISFSWLVIALLNKYIDSLNELHNQYFFQPPRSLERVGEFDYFGVNWDINRTTGFRELQNPDAERRVFIGTNPYCPVCGTELQQNKSLLGHHVWRCPAGDFIKRTIYSFLKKAEETQSVVRGQIRNDIIAQNLQ
jgi:hypothetical protein